MQCLDVLRSMRKEKNSVEVLLNGLNSARGINKNFDDFIPKIEKELFNADNLEFRARRVVEKLALALQAATLLQTAPDFVSDAFCNSRLSADKFLNFGTLPVGVEVEKIIERSLSQTEKF